MHQPDVCIVGAGIIGLSLALELERRGAQVTVLERDTPLAHASQAAAGMLAANDPENPPALQSLSDLSLRLYPGFLARIEALSGQHVPFQTTRTYQSKTPASHSPVFTLLEEHSLDPRQLAPALLAAVRATRIRVLDHTTFHTATTLDHILYLDTSSGPLQTRHLVHTLGSWSLPPVSPRKGQMLAVRIPPALRLDHVLRATDVYIVPRTLGPNAGRAIIGATVEDAGFSTHTDPASLARLRALAALLLPALADETASPTLDQWSGLRPNTPDCLPLLGSLDGGNQLIASGHYRNGILLAPATAYVLTQHLSNDVPDIDLSRFSPDRFGAALLDPSVLPIFAHPS